MKIMVPLGYGLILSALLAVGSAQAKPNYGVNSDNQPVVVGDRALPPKCPDWSGADVASAARVTSDYGCAINSNLALMVVDAQDLLHGKSDVDTDQVSATRAIKALREVEPTSKQWSVTTRESTKGGGK